MTNLLPDQSEIFLGVRLGFTPQLDQTNFSWDSEARDSCNCLVYIGDLITDCSHESVLAVLAPTSIV